MRRIVPAIFVIAASVLVTGAPMASAASSSGAHVSRFADVCSPQDLPVVGIDCVSGHAEFNATSTRSGVVSVQETIVADEIFTGEDGCVQQSHSVVAGHAAFSNVVNELNVITTVTTVQSTFTCGGATTTCGVEIRFMLVGSRLIADSEVHAVCSKP